jgi:phospholipid/cholesterol/gamma-HCH transport system substrate-binding protein
LGATFSVQRVLMIAARVVALAGSTWIALHARGAGARYHLRFTSAGLLVRGADVQIGGTRVGSVRKVSLTSSGEADVEIALKAGTPRLHAGTTASLEQPSLSGAANRYVALNPGPNSNGRLPQDAVIGSAGTTSVVELDELYDLFDPPTRNGVRQIVRGQADAFRGREQDAQRVYASLAPALQASDRVFRQLSDDGPALRRFLSASGRLLAGLHAGSDDLYGAVQETAQATDAFARAATPLEQGLRELPPTLDQSRRAFASLRRGVDTVEPFLGHAAKAGQGLPDFSSALRSTLTDGAPAIADLARLVAGEDHDDDLVALLRGLPSLSRAAVPSLSDTAAAARGGLPLIDRLRAYTPDLVAAWSTAGRAMANYDANGHYARVAPQFGAFREGRDDEGRTILEPIAPSERVLGLQDDLLRRCPGSASQALPDGSTPLASLPGQASLDCDAGQVPPGP